MACINPVKITYFDNEIMTLKEIEVPCGKCILCRERRVKDWTIKLINESKYYKKSCFVTLTFDNKLLADPKSEMWKYVKRDKETGEPHEPLPVQYLMNINNSKEYVKKFIKRLRKALEPKKIKYFLVGEYGDKRKRPHYHMIIFGENFDFDRKVVEVSQSGKEQYHSDTLWNAWKAGRVRISELNNRTVGYTAGYSLKKMKINDDKKTFLKNHIPVEKQTINKETGEKRTYTKWEYKWKPRFSYSNRAKMNAKFINKHPELLNNKFLEDEDKHKYTIPKSYIRALEKSDRQIHKQYLSSYKEEIELYVGELDVSMEKIKNLTKSKILESRIKERIRADL